MASVQSWNFLCSKTWAAGCARRMPASLARSVKPCASVFAKSVSEIRYGFSKTRVPLANRVFGPRLRRYGKSMAGDVNVHRHSSRKVEDLVIATATLLRVCRACRAVNRLSAHSVSDRTAVSRPLDV